MTADTGTEASDATQNGFFSIRAAAEARALHASSGVVPACWEVFLHVVKLNHTFDQATKGGHQVLAFAEFDDPGTLMPKGLPMAVMQHAVNQGHPAQA